jgi:hypothetical protein
LSFRISNARRWLGVIAIVLLSACSGGGDGDNAGRKFQLAPQTLTFTASSPDAETPPAQIVTATFGEGVTNITAIHTGPAVEQVDVTLSGTSAQIAVTPANPSAIGSGRFASTIAVTAYVCSDPGCTRLAAGETHVVNVRYQVSPVVNGVAPNVAIAGTAGNAIIRGVGFEGFTIDGVSFGNTAASEIDVVSSTEIRAKYPELAAGTYPVTIVASSHEGDIPSTATLTVVEPVVHAAGTLAWPSPVTAVRALEYDAQRSALLAATDAQGGQLVRFAFSNSVWQPPTAVALEDLQDIALTTDGSQLIALSTSAVVPADPVNLTLGTPVAAPDLPDNSFLKSLAFLNTNTALITTGIGESSSTPLYAYIPRTGVVTQLDRTLNNAAAVGAANGAAIVMVQGHPSLQSPPVVVIANASSGAINATTVTANYNGVAPAFDQHATRLVVNGTHVYDALLALLGKLPETTDAVAVHPNGKRAYTYDAETNALLVFDISEAQEDGAEYAPLGAPVPLVASPGTGVVMTISPDGNTLFIAGTAQIVVQPTPAL